jgi:hypothetical protein
MGKYKRKSYLDISENANRPEDIVLLVAAVKGQHLPSMSRIKMIKRI